MIAVKRHRDGKIFTSDMSQKDCILEIHFCTSYTQVIVQELSCESKNTTADIICEAIGVEVNLIDLIATQEDDDGEFITAENKENL